MRKRSRYATHGRRWQRQRRLFGRLLPAAMLVCWLMPTGSCVTRKSGLPAPVLGGDELRSYAPGAALPATAPEIPGVSMWWLVSDRALADLIDQRLEPAE